MYLQCGPEVRSGPFCTCNSVNSYAGQTMVGYSKTQFVQFAQFVQFVRNSGEIASSIWLGPERQSLAGVSIKCSPHGG